MTWVKICGLSRPEEVAVAVEAGADAVGFVLAESPRRVTVEQARALGEGLSVRRVIVTADLDPDRLMTAAREAGADGVQPHGAHRREAAAVAARAGLFVLHPVRMDRSADPSTVPAGQVPLLDSAASGLHGGTGRPFDWSLTAGIDRPFVLAGGLGPDNIEEALERVDPWGVDASSRLESAIGRKDPERIRAFVETVKRK